MKTEIQRGVYMLRNLVVGDGEQYRIEDLHYLAELPSEAKAAAKYMLKTANDQNTACAIYIRHMLKNITPDQFKVAVKEFLVDWGENMDVADMGKKDVKEYLDGLQEDLLSGFNTYVNKKSLEYLLF